MEIKYVERSLVIELNKKIIHEWNVRHPESSEFTSASESRLDEVLRIFLRRNGLNITFPKEEQRELRRLLFEIQEERVQLQQEIIGKLVLYIRKNSKSL